MKNFAKRLMVSTVMAGTGLFFISSQGTLPAPVEGLKVPEGYVIERIASPDLHAYPMFASYDDKGRMYVVESTGVNTMGTEGMLKNPTYQIRIMEDVNGDGIFDKSKVFADKLPFPMGAVYHKGSLFITASPNLIRLEDKDGDGVAEHREVIHTGWVLSHNGASLSGPFMGPDGWLYLTDARRGFEIKNKEGEILKGKGARIWRCRPDGSGLEWIAGGGFDNAVELTFMPSGETIGNMTYFTDPKDGFRDALMHWVEGGVYPKYNPVIDEDQLKLTGDLMPVMDKLPRVAPSGLMRFRGTNWGKDFKGNLFSAQFNTGRIIRHVLKPDGATYETTDEPFMTSEAKDSHPTDVLQDAAGDMIVVITGGWFIEGCPLSRVAMPEVKGGIFRIRKKGTPVVNDPWGAKLNIASASAAVAAGYLQDPRSAVVNRATDRLIALGDAAVPALKKILLQSADPELRAAVTFILYRAGTPLAAEARRQALNDKSPLVRTAAARAAGLAKDKKAVARLMEIVKKDQAQVRRQAATALGQIDDKRAVAALLSAASNPDDRFVEHAIIHSLIILGQTAPLQQALNNPVAAVKKAAIIALDQMDGRPLKKESLVPFLGSKDAELRRVGIWIASHHPDWSDVVVDFIEERTRQNKWAGDESGMISELMLTFSRDQRLQNFMAGQLADKNTPSDGKLLLIDVINRASLNRLPAAWVKSLGVLLQPKEDSKVQQEVLNVIASRRITALSGEVERMAFNTEVPVDFRLKAMRAKILTQPEISEKEFNMLIGFLGKDYDSPTKQLVVQLLDQAKLDNAKVLFIAREVIDKADPFMLPWLLNCIEGSTDKAVGDALIRSLSASDDRLDNVSEEDLQRLFKPFPASVKEASEPLMKTLHARHAERLEKLEKLEKQLVAGDVGEGRKLFYGKASCYLCHAVGGEGGTFGPDLTNIGDIRSRHDMLEAIVYPSVSFAREHETFKVVTRTSAYTGIIKEQLPEAIVIAVGPAPGIRIPRSEIVSIEPQNMSMMPPGLDEILTIEEMSDLIAYMRALPYRLDRMLEDKTKK